MIWLNEPPRWSEDDGVLRVSTAPDTDFWRTTHYGFVRDTGHFRYEPVAGDFVARVRVEGGYRDQYDQAGLMVRLDPDNSLKCGVEYVDGRQTAGAVVTRGLSDWSFVPLDPAPPSLWIEVRRKAEAVHVSYGVDEPSLLLRLGALSAESELQVGVMAASPDGAGFDVAFHGFSVAPADDGR